MFGYTLAYAPLEQILGRKTDARSDVYAVGATLYHLLTGYPPVNARDRSRAVASGTPDPLPAAHLVGADIPENLGRLIARAMALDGADRYASARDMRAALNECGVDQTTHVSTPDHHGASRRIDVAAPSRAEVGRQIDLLVQVRFETSTRLGLEDWPSKARPTEIEQVSEALQLAYPTDPQTGGVLPARLRIKLVAPDFRVDGQADRLIEVPPDEYSKRLAFLLTPLRAGSCRINVEVYGLDDLFLGAVPVEIVAVAGAVSEQEICVGNLVLEVVARQVAALLLGARIAAASSPAPLAAADAGSAAITMPSSSVPIVEGAASQIAAAAGASARSPDTQTYGRLTGRGDPAEQSPKRRLSRVARVTAPLAVVVFAVAVLLTIRGERQVPASVESTPAAAPTSAPGAISAPATAPAAALLQQSPRRPSPQSPVRPTRLRLRPSQRGAASRVRWLRPKQPRSRWPLSEWSLRRRTRPRVSSLRAISLGRHAPLSGASKTIRRIPTSLERFSSSIAPPKPRLLTRERRRMLRERKTGPSTPMPTRAFRQHATRVVPLDRRTRRQSFVNSARPRSCTGLLPRESRRPPDRIPARSMSSLSVNC